MGGIRHKETINPNLAAKLESIPVWPKEISLAVLNKMYGKGTIPTDAPIGEDRGWVCYPTVKDKETYMRQIHELVRNYKRASKRAVRIRKEEREDRWKRQEESK